MGGPSCAQGSFPCAVDADEVGRMTGLFPSSAEGTPGAPGDDGPCPVNC